MGLHTKDWVRIAEYFMRLIDILINYDPKERKNDDDDNRDSRERNDVLS
jgi:hypothetical protein